MTMPAGGGPDAFRSGPFFGILIVVGLVGLFIAVGPGRMRERGPTAEDRAGTERPVAGGQSPAPPAGAESDPAARRPVAETLAKDPASDPGRELARARAAREEARVRYEAARAGVAEAQALMSRSERDVEELERFIEELEARGEDPVDHADEGMERFMPAFEAYEVAIGRLERAEEEEAIARLEFLAAEQRLQAARRHADSTARSHP